jgi:hypothetical protein
MSKRAGGSRGAGKLRIGDDWNAIRIIALSQSNPLKAVAELVENSIDAGARQVVITKGRARGQPYLKVSDDGEGVRRDTDGRPDFRYVATHICDSFKRKLKAQGINGVQGEFGIGLLSFWTVGEELVMRSADAEGRTWQMHLQRNRPDYAVTRRHTLIPPDGTELKIQPLLPGLRHLTGDRIQWYLASELRDRIRRSGVEITVIDRQARRQFRVEPRTFNGRLLGELPTVNTPRGEAYLELYLAEPAETNRVGLYRAGTRVLADLAELDALAHEPWTSRYLQGIVDAPFLTLTPGTRSGVVHDEALAHLQRGLLPLEHALVALIDAQKQAEEERASEEVLRSIRRAFREAMLALPREEYAWFDLRGARSVRAPGGEPGLSDESGDNGPGGEELDPPALAPEPQRQFFEFAGPLQSVRISPASSVVPVNGMRSLRAVARDRAGRLVEDGVAFEWRILDGGGTLAEHQGEIVNFTAPGEPALVRVAVTARQEQTRCEADALITVTESLVHEVRGTSDRRGLPDYTFEHAPGELWRSRYDLEHNLIVVNNGHRDFVFASRSRALKLRYISRLFAKELVLRNFPGVSGNELLERLIELTMYLEENLR